MPYATSSDGARIHYEVHGSGEPVLLVMGLGSNAYGWHRTIPWLSARYEAVAFDELPSIAAPTLVVHGAADLLVPTANGTLLAGRIPGAELVLVPGAGHMLQADAGDVVRDAVLAFLARVAQPQP